MRYLCIIILFCQVVFIEGCIGSKQQKLIDGMSLVEVETIIGKGIPITDEAQIKEKCGGVNF